MGLPLTQRQTLMWLDVQLYPGVPFHNVVVTVEIRGALDPSRLAAAWRQTVADRDVLRMTIDAQAPRQSAIAPEAELSLIELAGDEAMAAWIAERCVRGFADGARWEAALLRLAGDRHVFYLCQDHLLTDGTSVALLLEHLASRYQGLTPPVGPPFADYVEAEAKYRASPEARVDQEYWRSRLAAPPPPLRLYGKARTDPSPVLRSAWLTSDRDLAGALRSLADDLRFRSVSAPLSRLGVVATALAAFLYRASGQREILLGIPIANRNARFRRSCGLFMEQIFLRLEVEEGETYASLAGKVRRELVEGLRHGRACVGARDVAYVTLNMLPPLPTRFAEFDAACGLGPAVAVPGIKLAAGGDLRDTLGLRIFDFAEGPLRMAWDLHAATFDPASEARCRTQFLRVLAALAADAAASIDEVDLLDEEGRKMVLAAARGPEPAGAPPDFVQKLRSRTAERPGANAASGPEGTITYQELARLSDALAARLRAMGVVRESRVGIALPRGLRELVAMIATLKAGGVYVPLDLEHPVDRLRVVLEDAAPEVLISTSGASLGQASLPGCQFLAFDELHAFPPDDGRDFAAPEVEADQLAYILFTSGSTGRPKGVEIPRGALANFLRSMERQPGLADTDRLLAITTTTFDIAGLELFLPLWVGGSVAIADRETVRDSRLLRERLAQDRITVLQATPATWRLLLEAGFEPASDLRMFCGGEPLSRELADRLLAHGGQLWNLYGPTETTVWSTLEQVERGPVPITIGRPIDHTQLYVLDRLGRPVPPGVVGEIVIGGRGLARGYRGRPDLTSERFVPDLFGPPGARLYRTGDLGRLRDDGRFECLGRVDHQVKVNGFRIELGEIESVLRAVPGVTEVLVVATAQAGGDPLLCAYWTGEATREGLYQQARAKLPAYMVPSAYVQVPVFPLTTSGKIDRKALPPAQRIETASATLRPPTNEAERRVARIFGEVLGITVAGIDQDFFELGGTSVLVLQARDRLEREFGVTLPLRAFFTSATVSALAAQLTQPTSGQAASGCLVQLKPGTGKRALFLIHDADGEVLLYRNLALRMPRDVAVYGVVPLASGRLPMVHTSVEAMAAHYLREIRACQPEGPYYLGGLCAGGVIAFAVAQQLVDQGATVDLLALIEAVSPRARLDSHVVARTRWHRATELFASTRSQGLVPVVAESGRRVVSLARYEAELLGHNLLTSSLIFLLERRRRPEFAWPDWLLLVTCRGHRPTTTTGRARAAARPLPGGRPGGGVRARIAGSRQPLGLAGRYRTAAGPLGGALVPGRSDGLSCERAPPGRDVQHLPLRRLPHPSLGTGGKGLHRWSYRQPVRRCPRARHDGDPPALAAGLCPVEYPVRDHAAERARRNPGECPAVVAGLLRRRRLRVRAQRRHQRQAGRALRLSRPAAALRVASARRGGRRAGAAGSRAGGEGGAHLGPDSHLARSHAGRGARHGWLRGRHAAGAGHRSATSGAVAAPGHAGARPWSQCRGEANAGPRPRAASQ